MARDEWFRSPAWDEQIEAAFEQQLPRARPYNQPQYIRIQATHLLSSPDPRVREAGRGLLQRVITTFPDGSEARTAMEQLGGSLADEGRLGEAEQALRERCGYARRALLAGPAPLASPSSGWPR